jgi:hypothetical protein
MLLTKHGGYVLAVKDLLAIVFGLIALIGVGGGIANRIQLKKGMGTQFIRYIALVVALPLAGALVFQGMMTEAVVTLIIGILGYLFPGTDRVG